MFKQFLTFFLFVLLCCSCSEKVTELTENEGYVLNISVKNANNSKSYLYKLSTTPISIVDSTTVNNNVAIFSGKIISPERYLITIDTLFGGKMIIIENDSIQITVTDTDLTNSKITGSKLNDELINFQKKSEKIVSKIDLIFPDLQRARLENNVNELLRISDQVKTIIKENIDYSFKYVIEHPNSYISAMILNDLSKRDSINVNRISKSYDLLDESIKKSIDAQKKF